MRQIVLDTETTGIGHAYGHKLIEIGCLELIDRQLTGRQFHTYLNPKRAVDEGAFRVHGISNAFLEDKPLFQEVSSDFLEFIQGAQLIIHNAPFDVGFINAELKHIKSKKALEDYCSIIDTLVLARDKHPGQRNNLDALCKRYDVNNANRTLHGALLDAEILSYVYLAMTGGQTSFAFDNEEKKALPQAIAHGIPSLNLPNAVVIAANAEELSAHQAFVDLLKKTGKVKHFEPVDGI